MSDARRIEHEEIAWVQGDELMELPLAPSDRRDALHRLGRAGTDAR